MKYPLIIRDFDSPIDVRRISTSEILLLDSSVLIGICHGGVQPPGIEKLMRNGARCNRALAVCFPDFIEKEAYNAEKKHYGTFTVHDLIKSITENPHVYFVELKTPIAREFADKRNKFLDLLGKRDRNIVLKRYLELSGTDLSLLAISKKLQNSGLKVTFCSSDRKLIEAAESLGVAERSVRTFNIERDASCGLQRAD